MSALTELISLGASICENTLILKYSVPQETGGIRDGGAKGVVRLRKVAARQPPFDIVEV